MSRKSKGINAERSLIHLFWSASWAAVRVAGSGSSRYPSPDILAGNNIRKLAIECKASRDKAKYLTKEEVTDLISFAKYFGAEPWIGVKFDKMDWFFISPEDAKDTGKNYLVSEEIVKNKGLLFSELIK